MIVHLLYYQLSSIPSIHPNQRLIQQMPLSCLYILALMLDQHHKRGHGISQLANILANKWPLVNALIDFALFAHAYQITLLIC